VPTQKMFDYSYRYTDEVIAENGTNPLYGEDNTIGNEKENALNKKGKKRKKIENKNKIKREKN